MRLHFIIFLGLIFSQKVWGQLQEIKLDPVKVEKFSPYLKYKHSYPPGFEVWKENHKLQYVQELWYYTESFYIKRDYFTDGIALNEEIIDISRWEKQRSQTEEVTVKLKGFKDALVLIPGNKLIFKPE
jgi:hypothetical protein